MHSQVTLGAVGTGVARPPWLRSRRRRSLLILAVAAIAIALIAASMSLAYFTDDHEATAAIAAGQIFPGTRTSSAFDVSDSSGGGAAVDGSSPFASAGDGRTVATGSWDAGFAPDRYLQFDFSAPLPVDLGVSGATLRLAFASISPTGTGCVFVEVRRISDDAILASYGSASAPVACVTGTGLTSFTQPLPAIASTNAANDLRVRIYGDDSDGAGSVIDEATVTGSTPFVSFSLYPVRFTDAATGVPVSAPWDLQGP